MTIMFISTPFAILRLSVSARGGETNYADLNVQRPQKFKVRAVLPR